MVLSLAEIDALLATVDDPPMDMTPFIDELALHERIYTIFRSNETPFATAYTTSIEGYPYKKLKPLLERINNQIILSRLYDPMSPYAKIIYETICMKREDTYLEFVFDKDYRAPEEEGRSKEKAFINAYLYMLHLPQTLYESDEELIRDLRQIEKEVIVPMQNICEAAYPMGTRWMKRLRALRGKRAELQNTKELRTRLQRYATLQQHARIEFCSKKELVDKLVFLAIQSRHDGILTVYDHYLNIEKLPLIKILFEAMPYERFETTFQEHKHRYLESMRQKLDFIAHEFLLSEDNYAGTEIPGETYNPNHHALEEYTMEELAAKRDHYRRIYTTMGVVASEKDAYEEKNSLLKAVLGSISDGYVPEWIEKYVRHEVRHRIRHYETLFDILEEGLSGLFDGDSPRSIHRMLMSFFDESQRWEFDHY